MSRGYYATYTFLAAEEIFDFLFATSEKKKKKNQEEVEKKRRKLEQRSFSGNPQAKYHGRASIKRRFAR